MKAIHYYDVTNNVLMITFEIPENEIVEELADRLMSAIKTAWETYNGESGRPVVESIDCPRAKSGMTPCIARDGRLALTDETSEANCVGCWEDPFRLLYSLGNKYPPAKKYRQTKDAEHCADRLKEMVNEYVRQGARDNGNDGTRIQ